jgi:hypothetical protein
MWRAAVIRGAAAGSISATLGFGRLLLRATDAQNASSNQIALLIAIVSGVVTIIVALITVTVPWWLNRLASRDPDTLEARKEATDALAEALVQANRDKERAEAAAARLERKLAERDES